MTHLTADLGGVLKRQSVRDDPRSLERSALEVPPLGADLEEPGAPGLLDRDVLELGVVLRRETLVRASSGQQTSEGKERNRTHLRNATFLLPSRTLSNLVRLDPLGIVHYDLPPSRLGPVVVVVRVGGEGVAELVKLNRTDGWVPVASLPVAKRTRENGREAV